MQSKTFLCYTFFISLLLLSSQLFSHELNKIYVHHAPKMVKDKSKKANSVIGFADVRGDYESYYHAYRDNTAKIEDEHFEEKILKKKNPRKNFYLYELVFDHWFVGELFRLVEKHKKLIQVKWWGAEKDMAFSGQKKANMWQVIKFLDQQTKDSWVGDRFKYLSMDIRFISMGENKTRIYIHIVVDAQGNKTTKEIKQTTRNTIAKIIAFEKK